VEQKEASQLLCSSLKPRLPSLKEYFDLQLEGSEKERNGLAPRLMGFGRGTDNAVAVGVEASKELLGRCEWASGELFCGSEIVGRIVVAKLVHVLCRNY